MIELIKQNYIPFLIGVIISYALFIPRTTTTREMHATTKTVVKTVTKTSSAAKCVGTVKVLPGGAVEVTTSSSSRNAVESDTSATNESTVATKALGSSKRFDVGVSIKTPLNMPLSVSKESVELSIGIPLTESLSVEGSYKLDNSIGLGLRFSL